MLRIGVLGGSFDPIHYAHLSIASQALKQFHLDRVLFIPVKTPPHKKSFASPLERLNMVQLAIQNEPCFFLSTVEMDREGISYTIDTVQELYQNMPILGRLYWILGEDLLLGLPKWKNFDQLKNLVHWIVFARDSFLGPTKEPTKIETTENFHRNPTQKETQKETKKETKKERILTFSKQLGLSLDYLAGQKYRASSSVSSSVSSSISSSRVRACIKKGEPIHSLVPESVVKYIAHYNLYRNN